MNPETLAIARENLISLGIRPTVDDIMQEARRMETMNSQTRTPRTPSKILPVLILLALLDTAHVNPVLRSVRNVLETRIL